MNTMRHAVLLAPLSALMNAPAESALVFADAELIELCCAFAEGELASWYRFMVAPAELADEQDTEPDYAALEWITATPATTPAGFKAKALAYSAWDRDAYDETPDSSNRTAGLLVGLLRDMVGTERDAVMRRLATQYGPLPAG